MGEEIGPALNGAQRVHPYDLGQLVFFYNTLEI